MVYHLTWSYGNGLWSSRKVSQIIHNFVKMTEAKLNAPFLERWQIGGCKKFFSKWPEFAVRPVKPLVHLILMALFLLRTGNIVIFLFFKHLY